MWELWSAADDDAMTAYLSAAQIVAFWQVPPERREEAIARLAEACFDAITELRDFEAES